DNGLLTCLARLSRPTTIVAVTEPRFWLPKVSATFHGRDIMAPVAARLSLGLDPRELGPAVENLVMFELPEAKLVPGKIVGSVSSVDSFGNLVTDISADMLAGAPHDGNLHIECDEHETTG